MTGTQVALGISTLGVAGGGVAETLLKEGNDLGQMGSLGIMGVCMMALVATIVVLYRQHNQTSEKLMGVISKNIEITTKATEKIEASTDIEKDVVRVLADCKSKSGS